MANTYAWTINKLDVRPTQDSLSDIVYNIHNLDCAKNKNKK